MKTAKVIKFQSLAPKESSKIYSLASFDFSWWTHLMMLFWPNFLNLKGILYLSFKPGNEKIKIAKVIKLQSLLA